LPKLTTVALLLLLALLLAACGSKKQAVATTTTPATTATGRGPVTCSGAALSGSSGLAAMFPVLPEVTFVKTTKSGPTTVVDGYGKDGIDGIYAEWNDQLKTAQYTILFHEIELKRGDAEISYKSHDGKTEGQIALRTCSSPANTTSVHITARPA
jgi:hypothetical protein